MKKIVYFILATLALFSTSSCGKFLTPNSPSLYIPATAKDLSEMLIGDAYPVKDVPTLFKAVNSYSDDVEIREDFEVVIGLDQTQYFMDMKCLYSWHPDVESEIKDQSYDDTWTASYKLILGCNAALDYIDKVTGSSQEKGKIRAEAITLRAFYYFHLVNTYAEPYNYNKNAPGIPLKLTSTLVQEPLPRSSVAAVYQQMEKDLKEAETLLKELDKDVWYNVSARVSLPVVYNMLSRIYLYMENWGEAARYAKLIMDIETLGLYDLNGFQFDTKHPYPCFTTIKNKETFWVYCGVNVAEIYNTYGNITIQHPTTGKTIKPLIRLFGASKSLINSYDDIDLRKELYLVREWCDEASMPYPEKYNLISCVSKSNISDQYASINEEGKFGMSMRLGEVYLNYAEACFNNNQKDEALKAINDLRLKRIKKENYTELPSITIEEIRGERRRELCFEVQRWYDLRRWGMPSFSRKWVEMGNVVNQFSMEKNDAAYMVQIPKIVFDKNPRTELNRKPSVKID